MSKKTKKFSLFVEIQVIKTGQAEKTEGRNNKAKSRQSNHKLRSQNYHFASD